MDSKRIQKLLAEFASQRDWDQYHSPKNLSMALAGEAGELLDVFQWLTEAESHNLDARTKALAQEEMADVLLYLLRLADKLNINLEEAAEAKIKLNAVKYPVEASKGNADKYNRRKT